MKMPDSLQTLISRIRTTHNVAQSGNLNFQEFRNQLEAMYIKAQDVVCDMEKIEIAPTTLPPEAKEIFNTLVAIGDQYRGAILTPTEIRELIHSILSMSDKARDILAASTSNSEVARTDLAKAKSSFDVQVGGDHYKSMPVQPMELALANNLNAAQANVIKYIMRYKAKGGVQDLDKAIHCIQLLKDFEYGDGDKCKKTS
ncbi:DUF3310 domain-containing protein [Undibacterium sp. Di26W]|uniref:DUF3310 domain-containing protein n=1 Tax=Undibacterium sp. Di26W TaxID=3413035 RepID=UPI003BF34B87